MELEEELSLISFEEEKQKECQKPKLKGKKGAWRARKSSRDRAGGKTEVAAGNLSSVILLQSFKGAFPLTSKLCGKSLYCYERYMYGIKKVFEIIRIDNSM